MVLGASQERFGSVLGASWWVLKQLSASHTEKILKNWTVLVPRNSIRIVFFNSFGVVTAFNMTIHLSSMLAPTWLHFRGPGASWGALGRSWAAFGRSWGILGAFWARLGASWSVLDSDKGFKRCQKRQIWRPGCGQPTDGKCRGVDPGTL